VEKSPAAQWDAVWSRPIGGLTYDRWFQNYRFFQLSGILAAPVAGFICYLALTFIYYWWHRVRHTSELLWVTCHQLHHSPARIETITSFYKHPLEILANGLIIGIFAYSFLGLSAEAGGWVTLYSAAGEYIYHMNIRTPRIMGYFFRNVNAPYSTRQDRQS
jgi:sterol desaturase/sphingolipid hydroxylase (fatty acid hydroxylase superfamily)